mmetsp:Transcript_16659/g.58250  ORF Transcript_16659/g.58250 Transcript_16659/m.58250 type:complete len:340 (-) Transcript_16659:47-1066(-)
MAEAEEKKAFPAAPRPPRHPTGDHGADRGGFAAGGAGGSFDDDEEGTGGGGGGGVGSGGGSVDDDVTAALAGYGGSFVPKLPSRDAKTRKKKKKRKKKAAAASGGAPPALLSPTPPAYRDGKMVRRGGGYSVPAAPVERVTHPAVLELFRPDRDDEVPYTEQGDPTMYTPENLARREELRRNPGLQDAIKRFSRLFEWRDDGTMSKAAYLDMHRRLVAALLPGASADAAAALAEKDWAADAGGADADSIGYEGFFGCVFVLTDHWTQTADAAEYLAFVNALCLRCKYAPKPAAPATPSSGGAGAGEGAEAADDAAAAAAVAAAVAAAEPAPAPDAGAEA